MAIQSNQQAPAPTAQAPAARETDGGSSGRRVQLKGASYSDGAAALRPGATGGYAQGVEALMPEGGAPPSVVQRKDDPRLGYNAKDGKDPEHKNLDAKRVPYTKGDTWNARAILTRLTQIDNDDETLTDNDQCAANAVLGATIMAGPSAVLGLAMRTGALLKKHAAASDASKALPKPLKGKEGCNTWKDIYELCIGHLNDQVLPNLKSRTTEYNDLQRLAAAVYRAGKKDNTKKGTDDGQLTTMAGLAGKSKLVGTQITSKAQALGLFKKLNQREAYLVSIDTQKRHALVGYTQKELDHQITIGMDESSKVYLYDPAPKTGTQLLDLQGDSKAFWAYFIAEGGSFKASTIDRHTTPKR